MMRSMPAQVLYAARALTPSETIENPVVVIEDAHIAAIGPRGDVKVPTGATERDVRALTVVPGFVDLHIHGAGGHDVMEADETALAAVASTVARTGTTSLVATTVTASLDHTCRSLEGIARYIQSPQNQRPLDEVQAEIIGIHLEGPFISPARRGVHPENEIVAPSVTILEKFLHAAGGRARILTLAPELPGALELVDRARDSGLLVALGHTDATYEQACAAIERGVRHAVHIFNAMRPFSHRETGVLGAVLTHPEVTAEVIADGVHVDVPAIRLLLAAKGPAHVLLASDSTAATGMPDGTYRLGTFEVVVSGGVCRNREGRLAGSTLTLDRAVRHMVSLGIPLIEAVRMAALYPARQLGLAEKKGILAPGADADLALLTPELKVAGVMTRGVGLK
jgi:N-acetylglucosamine-6-phosphate deacetylase